MSEHPHPWQVRLFAIAAVIGVGGWLLLLGLWAWWSFQPTNLPTITEPIPVLNPEHAVAIGTPIVLELAIAKPRDIAPHTSTRFLECTSGNLVTLTATPTQLPEGNYTVVSDNVVLPAKVTPGDTCVAVFLNTYEINPIREETTRFASEPFTVLPAAENG